MPRRRLGSLGSSSASEALLSRRQRHLHGGALSDGNGRALFRLAAEQRLELVSSRYALEEAARNIAVKFPECVAEFNTLIVGRVLVAEPSQAEIQLAATRRMPDKDGPILAAAIAARASALVTGDRRDFGHLYGTTAEGVAVLTPAEAVSKVLSSRVAK